MSMRKAINDFCKSCIYDDCSPGTWRKQVELCTISDCALYPYRPITEKSKAEKSANSTGKKRPQPVCLRRASPLSVNT